MSKPDDIAQDVWDEAIRRSGVYAESAGDTLGELRLDFARAILAAEKRGEEREREACAVTAEERHHSWGTHAQIKGIEVEDDISACAEIAAAIRKRGEA